MTLAIKIRFTEPQITLVRRAHPNCNLDRLTELPFEFDAAGKLINCVGHIKGGCENIDHDYAGSGLARLYETARRRLTARPTSATILQFPGSWPVRNERADLSPGPATRLPGSTKLEAIHPVLRRVDMIGKIARRPLREVWKHEALDFTTWLVDNIDVLSEALDVPLQDAKREHAAGDFSVDLVAEDDSGNTVVIENQLEKSNHDHLGKLVTYLSALDARVAVWIVSEPRPEHTKAITWLNESRQASFYLVKAEAICIDNSNRGCPAFLLNIEKRSLPRLMLSGDGLASNGAV
jgi:hypothetical protein